MANTYKKPKRAINVVTIKGYSTSAEDMPNDPKASNAYRAFQAHETVEIKTSDTETFLIPFHAIAEFQSFLDTATITKKDPYCDDDGIIIKMNLTYEESVGGMYEVSGTAPKADSDSLEVGKSYTVTVEGSNGEGFTFAGVATETQVGDNETAIVVSYLHTGVGTMNGDWVFSTSADNNNEFGNSVTITITEGGGGGDIPK